MKINKDNMGKAICIMGAIVAIIISITVWVMMLIEVVRTNNMWLTPLPALFLATILYIINMLWNSYKDKIK